VERATVVAQKQYKSLLAGLQAVRQVKGWKVQQIVFVGRDAEQGGGQEQVQGPDTCPMGHVCETMARADCGQVTNSRFSEEHGNWGCFACLLFSLVLLSLLSLSLIKSPC
jgi:hypothetical protein